MCTLKYKIKDVFALGGVDTQGAVFMPECKLYAAVASGNSAAEAVASSEFLKVMPFI